METTDEQRLAELEQLNQELEERLNWVEGAIDALRERAGLSEDDLEALIPEDEQSETS